MFIGLLLLLADSFPGLVGLALGRVYIYIYIYTYIHILSGGGGGRKGFSMYGSYHLPKLMSQAPCDWISDFQVTVFVAVGLPKEESHFDKSLVFCNFALQFCMTTMGGIPIR